MNVSDKLLTSQHLQFLEFYTRMIFLTEQIMEKSPRCEMYKNVQSPPTDNIFKSGPFVKCLFQDSEKGSPVKTVLGSLTQAQPVQTRVC